jgi:hypothetical protein
MQPLCENQHHSYQGLEKRPSDQRSIVETGSILMQDIVNFALLGCAILASLAFGMLAAYSLCRSAFAVLRMHANSVAASRLEKASAAS